MIRMLLCSALVLSFGFGDAFGADDKKKDDKKPEVKKDEKQTEVKKEEKKRGKGKGRAKRGTAVAGVVKKFDASTSTVTITVKGRKKAAATEQEVKIPDSAKIVSFEGGSKKDGKDGLKDLKEGVRVVARKDADGNVTNVTIGNAIRRKKK